MIPHPSPARRRACAIGAWTLLLAGLTHAGALVVGVARSPSAAEAATRRAMAGTHVPVAGLDRTLWQLFLGFSLATALVLAALGALNLLALRRTPHLFLGSRAALWLNLGIVLAALLVSVPLLPPPPIGLLAIAAAAFGVALTRPSTAADFPTG